MFLVFASDDGQQNTPLADIDELYVVSPFVQSVQPDVGHDVKPTFMKSAALFSTKSS